MSLVYLLYKCQNVWEKRTSSCFSMFPCLNTVLFGITVGIVHCAAVVSFILAVSCLIHILSRKPSCILTHLYSENPAGRTLWFLLWLLFFFFFSCSISRQTQLFLKLEDFFWREHLSKLALPYGIKGSGMLIWRYPLLALLAQFNQRVSHLSVTPFSTAPFSHFPSQNCCYWKFSL